MLLKKKPISDLATVGIYYFRRARNFQDSAMEMIAENDRVNEFTHALYITMIGKDIR